MGLRNNVFAQLGHLCEKVLSYGDSQAIVEVVIGKCTDLRVN